MRVETGIGASWGGSLARWAPPVAPVGPVGPSVAARPASSADTPERSHPAPQLAAAIAASTGIGIDATGLGLRARQAVHAYAMVRDGDRREYLHRVFGLEARA